MDNGRRSRNELSFVEKLIVFLLSLGGYLIFASQIPVPIGASWVIGLAFAFWFFYLLSK